MANTKITQHVIADDAITTAMITDANITPAKLHGTLDLSSKTLTLPATAIPSASTATTQAASDNTTKLATTAYVTTAIANLNDSAPSALNTLNELAAALNDDASFSSTITTALGTKLPLAGGTMTGNIAHASDFALDVGGNITLDADGGSVFFKDGGTEFFKARKVGTSHIQLYSAQNDVDIKIEGVDGGVGIAALTLDMSEAGFAIFNSGGSFGGTGALRIPQGTTGQRPSAAVGQIRWNTTDGALEVYNGSAWTAVGIGSSNKILDTFTADGSTTDFTLSVTPANEDALIVFIDGVYQEKGDYALTNAVLALDTAPASGEKLAVHITTASVHDGTSATNQQFTATAGQTAFTLSADPKSENNTQVYINGVYQQKTDYTVSGTTLTFDTGLTVGDVVEVNAFTVATLGNTDTVSEGTTNLYHTTARARSAISVSGNALSYNSSTGVITSAYEETPTFTGNTFVNSGNGGGVALKIGGEGGNGLKTQYVLASGHTNFQIGVATHAASVFSITPSTAAGNTTFTNAALNINASGSVGIGTASPSNLLSLKGSGQEWDESPAIKLWDSHNSKGWYVGSANNHTTGDFYIRSVTSEAAYPVSGDQEFTIKQNGNVGIGTTNPATNLHIDGVSNYNGVEIKGSGGSRPMLQFSNANNGDLGAIYGTEGNDLVICAGSSNAAAITIDSSGHVGIGDTNPQHPLKVHLTNGEIAMFGSNGMNSPGQYAGIGLGQVLANNTTYQKVSLVAEGRNSGSYVQDFHILVDTAGDPGSAVLSDSKLEIDGGTGAINMSSQPSALIYNGSSHTQSGGATQYTFPSTAFNVGGCYNTGNGRFTVATPGKYLVTCQLGLNASTTALTYLAMGPRLNDTGTVFFGGWSNKTTSVNQYASHTQSIVMDLQANDYLVFYIELSGTAVVLGGPHYTSVSVHKLS